MRTILLSGLLALGLAAPGSAAVDTYRFGGSSADNDFRTVCNTAACELAVAEGKIGDMGGAATWEVGLGVPTTAISPTTAQNSWTAQRGFNLIYDADGGAGGGGKLTFIVSGSTPNDLTRDVSLGGASTIFIRAFGSSTTSMNLTNLTFAQGSSSHLLDGGALSSNSTAQYLAFFGFDSTADWTVAGTAALGTRVAGSNPAFQIKITDVPPIPLPAAGLLLLGGLGALGVAARRRRGA